MSIKLLNVIKSPKEISQDLADRVKQNRIRRNFTQQELAERSGVSFGSVKRFEQSGEISLKHLIMISKVLRSSPEFDLLFPVHKYESIEEILKAKELKQKKRMRARKKKE